MKNSLFIILISLIPFMTSCAGSNDSPANDHDVSSETQPASAVMKLPDAVIRVKIKQGESLLKELNFTLKGQKATTQAATCS